MVVKRTPKFMNLSTLTKNDDLTKNKGMIEKFDAFKSKEEPKQEAIDNEQIIPQLTRRDYWEAIAEPDAQGNFLDIGNLE